MAVHTAAAIRGKSTSCSHPTTPRHPPAPLSSYAEEYEDPLLGGLMRDPVRLPSGGWEGGWVGLGRRHGRGVGRVEAGGRVCGRVSQVEGQGLQVGLARCTVLLSCPRCAPVRPDPPPPPPPPRRRRQRCGAQLHCAAADERPTRPLQVSPLPAARPTRSNSDFGCAGTYVEPPPQALLRLLTPIR